MTVRTRMAPSPTGEFHIGGLRTLLYNYAWAKQNNGQFVLRIEDTDKKREVPGALARIIKVIRDYGLSWDEGPEVEGPYGPYIQSQRLHLYKDHALSLIAKGKAYYCFCTAERLDKMRDDQKSKGAPVTKYDKQCQKLSKEEVEKNLASNVPYVIRLKVPENEIVTWQDAILGSVSVNSNEVDDQVLLKSDGFPTYHLGVVVDDYLMKINYVLRGVEWLPSTPKQLLLYSAFGWEAPIYGHTPNLKEVGEHKKLSKRFGDVSAVSFLEQGYLPEAILNFLMLVGWNPGTEKEIYTLSEFVTDFSIERLHKTDLVAFDRTKLSWLNAHYINSILTTEELYQKLHAWAEKFEVRLVSHNAPKDKVLIVLDAVKDRIKKLSDYNEVASVFFEHSVPAIENIAKYTDSEEKAKDILHAFYELFTNTADWHHAVLDSTSHELAAERGWKPKEAFMTLRLAITGKEVTPPLFALLDVLGKDTVLHRLQSH